MDHNDKALPIPNKFFTKGMKILTFMMIGGLSFGLYRMIFGLGVSTNLDDQYPMGLWVGIDVATGVALAAGGFTSSALVYIFRREHYHALIRPALLTALLGYTFVTIGLTFDLGRWYNIWHPMIPFMWQGNSVLFEVGMCVMIYLTVLYIEFSPMICERFIGQVNLPGFLSKANTMVDTLLRILDFILGKIMFLFIIAGIVLSCLHQSSLGTLMVIAPYKIHPLYNSLLGPIFFLSSAMAVGLSMIIFESMIASKSLDRKPEMHLLTPLAKIIPYLLGIYIFLKIGDMFHRQSYLYLFDWSAPTMMFWIEFGGLTLIPFFLLMSEDVRRSPGSLLTTVSMIVSGIVLNRCTIFFIAYQPQFAEKNYIPALSEFALTIGLICTIIFVYRLVITIFPVLPAVEIRKPG
jgi:Ni/Fe-hydrogenase subunit HybB-like protein